MHSAKKRWIAWLLVLLLGLMPVSAMAEDEGGSSISAGDDTSAPTDPPSGNTDSPSESTRPPDGEGTIRPTSTPERTNRPTSSSTDGPSSTDDATDDPAASLEGDPAVGEYKISSPEILAAEHIRGKTAILLDGDTGQVLFAKNADERIQPASTTKIMTALLVLENVSIDELVTCGDEVEYYEESEPTIDKIPGDSSVLMSGESKARLRSGEELYVKDLLYGLMLVSGNDCANALAVYVAGSVSSFVEMMNRKAVDLGMMNTSFANPHGYEWEGHFSTARDMALLGVEAMKNDAFREIVGQTKYTVAPTNKTSDPREVTNRNALVRDRSENKYDFHDGIGIKTGYFKNAGQCYVSAAERDGKTLVCSTFNSADASYKWIDAIRMFRYGYAAFASFDPQEAYDIDPADVQITNAAASDAQGGNLELELRSRDGSDVGTISVPTAQLDSVKQTFRQSAVVNEKHSLQAPIEAGDVIGEFSYTASDGSIIVYDLVATRSVAAAESSTQAQLPVDESPAPSLSQIQDNANQESRSVFDTLRDYVWIIILVVVALIVLVLILIIRSVRGSQYVLRRRRKRRGGRSRY